MQLTSPVNLVTRRAIYPDLIYDFWFTESPITARLRENLDYFMGGSYIQSIFRFRPMVGNFYPMGATHTTTKVQTLADFNHDMKFMQVSIPEFAEELEVYNTGEEAVFSLLDEDLSNGLSTAGDIFSFALWGEGQSDPNRPNGFAEVIGDGLIPSWNGYVANAYGGQTRNGTIGGTLNGNIFWGGQANGSPGPINFPLINKAYSAATKGADEPDLIVGNKAIISYVIDHMEPQFRYGFNIESARDPYWGASGWRFRNAYIMTDEHAPSLEFGLSNADNYGLGNYLTAAFPNPLIGQTRNGFPTTATAANLTPAEVMFILNSRYMALKMSNSARYQFGFTGFMGSQDSERVVGRILASLNLVGLPRYQSLIYGINS